MENLKRFQWFWEHTFITVIKELSLPVSIFCVVSLHLIANKSQRLDSSPLTGNSACDGCLRLPNKAFSLGLPFSTIIWSGYIFLRTNILFLVLA